MIDCDKSRIHIVISKIIIKDCVTNKLIEGKEIKITKKLVNQKEGMKEEEKEIKT